MVAQVVGRGGCDHRGLPMPIVGRLAAALLVEMARRWRQYVDNGANHSRQPPEMFEQTFRNIDSIQRQEIAHQARQALEVRN